MADPDDPAWRSATWAAVDDLAPVLAGRVAEAERARRLPDDVVAALRAAGCFRMLVPAEYGGDALTLGQALAVVERLSIVDSAAGWNVMIAASNLVVLALFPKETFEDVYAAGPDVISAGSHAPKGRADVVAGGYRISGEWPFVSGCHHCSWVVTHSAVARDGHTDRTANGMPVMRLALVPASEVHIVDNWDVLGLRGTGSHVVRLSDVYCPDERTCELFGAVPTVPGTIFEIPPVSHLGLFIAAVVLGVAAAAVADVAAIATGGKVPAYGSRRVAQSPLFQARLGEADATLRAARALLYAEAGRAWRMAVDKTPFTLLDRARLRAASSRVLGLCAEVVTTAYQSGGGSALYDSAPLQRRLRDLYAITQHAGLGPDFFPLVGALLAGEDVDPMRI